MLKLTEPYITHASLNGWEVASISNIFVNYYSARTSLTCYKFYCSNHFTCFKKSISDLSDMTEESKQKLIKVMMRIISIFRASQNSKTLVIYFEYAIWFMLIKGHNHKCIQIPQSYNIWYWLFNYVCDRNSNRNENIVRGYFPLIMNLETRVRTIHIKMVDDLLIIYSWSKYVLQFKQ